MGGWQIEVTWGHFCDSGIALSPSQPQPCPWAVAALSHVMAHAIPGHTLSPRGWAVTSAPSQAGHIPGAALHPRPDLSYHNPKPWQ